MLPRSKRALTRLRGADVVLVARSEEKPRALAEELRREHGVRSEVERRGLLPPERREVAELRRRDEDEPADAVHLVLVGSVTRLAEAVEEHRPRKCVPCLALVQTRGDASPQVVVLEATAT